MLRSSDVLHPSFMTYVLEDDSDELYVIAPLSEESLIKILTEMLFALPIQQNRFYFLPNPSQRFCLDLRKQNIQWFRNRSMKQALPDFTLVISHDLKEALTMTMDYHNKVHESTWLTDRFIDQLHNLSMKLSTNSTSSLQLYCFKLIEKSTGKIAAMTFGFASGGFYEDYTMCTLIRDERSCGSILSKLVGCILQQIGIVIWYWGYEVNYMTDFVNHYGGGNIDRSEFYRVFNESRHIRLKPFSEVTFPNDLITISQYPHMNRNSTG